MDVDRLRAAFPALTTGPTAGLVRFDGPGGSLVPQVVADAVAAAMTAGMCQRGALTAPEQLTEATSPRPVRRWATSSAPTRAASSSVGR